MNKEETFEKQCNVGSIHPATLGNMRLKSIIMVISHAQIPL